MSGLEQEILEVWCTCYAPCVIQIPTGFKMKETWHASPFTPALWHCTEKPHLWCESASTSKGNTKLGYTKWRFSSRCFGCRFSFSCNKTPLIEFFWTQHGQNVLKLQCLQIQQTFKRRLFSLLYLYLLRMPRWRYYFQGFSYNGA